VTFDPFGDFETEGYLHNFEKEKDLAIVKRAENASFTTETALCANRRHSKMNEAPCEAALTSACFFDEGGPLLSDGVPKYARREHTHICWGEVT
jgi:hypothetical protein